jgi:2,3-bisphosphoglycerate-independent phosphoglycerate mutase
MDSLELIRGLAQPSPDKIILLVIDGLGGLPHPKTGQTELETARTPNLDKLFGYDPLKFNIGRGVVEAVGIDFNLKPGDIAARGNFCTVDEAGLITDRRAGRISTEKCAELCKLLSGMTIDGVKLSVLPVREYRFVIVFQGKGLAPDVSDSDPQQLGVAPKAVAALNPKAKLMSVVANKFIEQARVVLSKHHPANMLLLRGFSQRPDLPTMPEIHKLKPAAIAAYPMYRGLARLLGMQVLNTGLTIVEEMATLKENYTDYDFFFLHIKGTDSAGEDGDFERKVKLIEEADKSLPILTSLKPEVIVVTGDHSTPAILKAHSWHPLPIVLNSKWCRPDRVGEFSETACTAGGLGHFPATQIMPLAMAHALKLAKFGA